MTAGAVLMGAGISVYPGDGRDVNKLKVNADAAMYHAKRNDRFNTVSLRHFPE